MNVPANPKRRPWDRQDGETDAAYRAARAYFELGVNRSVAEANRVVTRNRAGPGPGKSRSGPGKAGHDASSAFKKWARRFRWAERAAAYDAHMAAARERAVIKAVETDEQEKARLRRESDVVTLGLTDRMVVKIDEMLNAPLYETVDELVSTFRDPKTGHTTNIYQRTVSPVRWSFRDTAAMLKVVRELKNDVLARPDPAAPAPAGRDPDADAEGLARVLANRARLREELLRAPAGPPKADGHSNGTGNGAAH